MLLFVLFPYRQSGPWLQRICFLQLGSMQAPFLVQIVLRIGKLGKTAQK